MKPNVDKVNLIATQELGDAPTPTLDDYVGWWPEGNLLGYKLSGHLLAELISTDLGSGTILPDRTYVIGSIMPGTSSLSPDGRQIIDPYLNGKVYDLHREGLKKPKGIEWDNTVPGGGVQLLLGGPNPLPFDTFNAGETVIISFAPQFSPYIPGPDAVGRFINGEEVITADTTATVLSARKLIRFNGASATLNYTLPPASTYPAGVIMPLVQDGGVNVNTTVICDGSDTIRYNGEDWEEFWTGLGEQLLLVRNPDGTGWRVVYFSGADHFNKLLNTNMGRLVGPNQWACISDAPVLRANYPRAWAGIKRLAAVQAAQVVDNATWMLNKGYFGLGDGDLTTGTTFNFPVEVGRFPRYVDPNGELDEDRFDAGVPNLPGNLAADALKKHKHAYTGPRNSGGTANFTGGGSYEPGDLSHETSEEGTSNENKPYSTSTIPLLNI